MTLFLKKPWIEKAVLCEEGEILPKKVKAQVTEVEDQNEYGEHFAVISDNKLYITALFSEEAVSTFRREQTHESFTEISGGFIIITKYKAIPKIEEANVKEFIIIIEHFKLYGGAEGTAPFSVFSNEVIDSKSHPPIANKLACLWEKHQLYELYKRYSPSFAKETKNGMEVEALLNKIHEVHTTSCLLTQRQSQPVTAKGAGDSCSGIYPRFEKSNLCHSQQTNSSCCSEPVFPDRLLDYADFEPLVLESNQNTQSQSLSLSEEYQNSTSQLSSQHRGNLSLLIGITDTLLNEADEQPQQHKKLIPRPKLSQMFSGTSCSFKRTRSEDVRNFIDEYWTMKYRRLNP